MKIKVNKKLKEMSTAGAGGIAEIDPEYAERLGYD